VLKVKHTNVPAYRSSDFTTPYAWEADAPCCSTFVDGKLISMFFAYDHAITAIHNHLPIFPLWPPFKAINGFA